MSSPDKPDDQLAPLDNMPPVEPVGLGDERTLFIRSGPLRLCVRQWGPDSAIPIVALHGLRGFSGTWRALAETLGARYRLIALDQRGRGESDWDPQANYYTDAYVDDLAEMVRGLGLGRFILLGHSMGGTTAYAYAARHPDRLTALIIEDIAPGSSVSGRGAERIKAEMANLPLRFADWGEARAYWRKTRPSVGIAALEQRLWESLRATADGRVGWRYDAEGISRTRLDPDPARVLDLWPVVAAIRTPALVIRGGRSDFCRLETVREMTRLNPSFAHATVAGASHYVHDDQPAAFNGLVEGFLCGIEAAGATVSSGPAAHPV